MIRRRLVRPRILLEESSSQRTATLAFAYPFANFGDGMRRKEVVGITDLQVGKDRLGRNVQNDKRFDLLILILGRTSVGEKLLVRQRKMIMPRIPYGELPSLITVP
jgi:hypothetical protein